MSDKLSSNALKFSFILVGVMFVAGIIAFVTGMKLGPPVGDLTRISGYSERQFSWQGKMDGFAQNHFSYGNYTPETNPEFARDLVVFGDSFSAPQLNNITWINTVYERTGLNAEVKDFARLQEVIDWYSTDDFQQNPPKVVIVEMGERTVFRRAESLFEQKTCPEIFPPALVKANPKKPAKIEWSQRSTFTGFDEVMSWGALALRLRILNKQKTARAELNRSDLFSNPLSDEILFYQKDILRHQPDQIAPYTKTTASDAVRCALKTVIASTPQGTEIYVTIAPDKRSAYQSWIQTDIPAKGTQFLMDMPGTLSGHYIDLYQSLLEQIRLPVQDIYFPNDTHWSAIGHKIVGETISGRISK